MNIYSSFMAPKVSPLGGRFRWTSYSLKSVLTKFSGQAGMQSSQTIHFTGSNCNAPAKHISVQLPQLIQRALSQVIFLFNGSQLT